MYGLFKVNEFKDESEQVEVVEFITPTEAFLREIELQQDDLNE